MLHVRAPERPRIKGKVSLCLVTCSETAACLSAYCIATPVLVRFEVSAQQLVYTAQY
jgi:hypothetical protein